MAENYTSAARLYEDFHVLYGKDYRREACLIAREVLCRHPGAQTLLDAACGSGLHLMHLTEHFQCVGVDMSPQMLTLAGAKGICQVSEGDLRTFDLGRTFDAVICMFSSIAYLRPLEELSMGVANLSRHMGPGGVLVLEPWHTPQTYSNGNGNIDILQREAGYLVRACDVKLIGTTTFITMNYWRVSGEYIEHHEERHILELYSFTQYCSALEAAGLDCEIVHPTRLGLGGRGLVIGVKR